MPAATAARTGRAQPCPDPTRTAPARPQRAYLDFLDLDPVLTSPRRARAWTREILPKWQLAGLADNAEAIVAELVANAVHASAGLIRFTLAFRHGELLILVSDENPKPPQAQDPAEDAESGRGLLMVKALSDGYGWHRLGGGARGKVVWAALRTEPGAASAQATPQDDTSEGEGQPGRR